MIALKLVLLGVFIFFILLFAGRENNVMKTVDDYLDSIKKLKFEQSKKYVLEENVAIISTLHDLKNEIKPISKLGLHNLSNEVMEDILMKDRHFLDMAYITTMNFDYIIMSSDLLKEGVYNVKVQINLQDSQEYLEYVEKLNFINQHKSQESRFLSMYTDISKYLEKYNVKKSEIMTLKVVKQGSEYFVENPNKIYLELSKPFTDFIEWR